jgi:hypothetical protein
VPLPGAEHQNWGFIMRKMGLVLALLSTMSMTVLPVAPSFAATSAPVSTEQKLAKYAKSGDLAVLSQAQMSRLAVSHPALHNKLLKASQNGTVPKLTAAEKKMVRTMTASNMDAFKAGDPATVWIVVAITVVVLLLLWQPVVCKVFPWAWGCALAYVRARG